ncbi:MAG TPA: hypothetical protein VMU68_10565 [Acidimicrobiales bacterium]|nr:hypothetical protein [Acidimicrobiales bacterium]
MKSPTTIEQLPPSANAHLDEEALIKEARVLARRRRQRRGLLAFTLLAVAGLIAVGVTRLTSVTTSSNSNDASTSATPICQNVQAKLLGVTAIPGGLGHAGVVVRASVSSSVACSISGYPKVNATLSSHSTATASDVRNAYLGGAAKTNSPLPRLSISSRPRLVSFTIQWADGNGPTYPAMKAVQISFPGSPSALDASSMYEPGMGNTQFMGIYRSNLIVTPLVKGSSGSTQ